MNGLSKDQLIFDPADLAASDNIGAYVRSSDGTLVTSTTCVGGEEALDVNVCNSLDIDVQLDGIYNGATNLDPDNVGIIGHVRNAAPGDPQQTVRLTAAAPDADNLDPANILALDVNSFLHGWDGSAWDRVELTNGSLNVSLDTVPDDDPDAGDPLKVGSRSSFGAPLSALSASNDRADLLSDEYRRIWVNNSSAVGVNAENIVVGTTEIAIPTTALSGRKHLLIQNQGPKSSFVGQTGVTVGTGLEVRKGQTLELSLSDEVSLFAISSMAGNNLRVLEHG